MEEMDDREYFVQRCLVLEHIINNAIPDNASSKEKLSVFATMLKQEIKMTADPEKVTEHFVRYLLAKDE